MKFNFLCYFAIIDFEILIENGQQLCVTVALSIGRAIKIRQEITNCRVAKSMNRSVGAAYQRYSFNSK